MLEVEEDPSSQFVDFTNATALEQFVSDAEQALIAWHLAGKGHASAESLEAAYGPQANASHTTTFYTRVLEMELPQRRASASNGSSTQQTTKYALTLFVSRGNASKARPETHTASGNNSAKQWQQGREHFTPTMLAIADASHDLAWRSDAFTGGESEALTADGVARLAERWFGVDEFLLVTRTSLPSEREKKLAQTQQQQRRKSRNAASSEDAESLQESPGGRAFDGAMDANEANLLLSAIHLALLNCNCTLPGFVPVQGVTKGTWLGTAVPGSTGNVSITFETDSIPEVGSNQTQSCISGLLDFFQLKLQLPPHIEDKCRLASGGEAAELSIGTWVSASFRYAWLKDEDPREAEKQAFEWRFTSSVPPGAAVSERKSLSQVLFGAATSRDHFWGTAANPVASVELTAMWPNLREGTYVDNAVHSTLDPQKAPEWMIDVQFDTKLSDWKRDVMDLSRKPTMPLSRIVANLVQAYSKARDIGRNVLVSELAPTVNTPPPSSAVSSTSSASSLASTAPSALSSSDASRLPESIPAARAALVLGNAIGSITSSIVSAATWKGTDVEEIRRVVAELFENGNGGDSAAGGLSSSSATFNWSVPSSVAHTTPVGELVSVLACRMGQLHGVNAMSLLWVEFVKSLRERWFLQRLLPLMSTQNASSAGGKFEGVAAHSLDAMFLLDATPVDLPNPDFRNCLLHQKLQLLNTCILRQAERKKSPSMSISTDNVVGTRMSDLTAFQLEEDVDDKESNHSDDEFFDSVEVQDSSAGAHTPRQPQGVRRPISGVACLLTGEPMMEPITQVAVPLTEDVARQQQDLLSRLGVGSESTMLRQQIQSAALVSDMQAFKAANPGACLADFIRWYSPKDWISSDPLSAPIVFNGLPAEGKDAWWFEGKGMLSERMRSVAGSHAQPSTSSLHLWHRMWDSSAPLPVNKQRCLFDPVEESEKLYHYLETISPHEMFHQMLVGAIGSCYAMLERSCLPRETNGEQYRLETVEAALQDLRKQCERAVTLLDDACVESQVAYPAGRDQKEEQERAKTQLHLAFDMALDACRAMTRVFEEVEMMLSQASALLQYFTGDASTSGKLSSDVVELVDLLLGVSYNRVPRGQLIETRRAISKHLRSEALRSRVASLVLHNPSSRDPIHREYVIRCICPRPYLDDFRFQPEVWDAGDDDDDGERRPKTDQGSEQDESAVLDLLEESPVVVNRMYASFTNQTVRFALTLAESEF